MVNDSFNLSTHKKALKLFCREREGEYIQAGGQAAMCLHASVYILCQELVDSFQSHIHGLTAVPKSQSTSSSGRAKVLH